MKPELLDGTPAGSWGECHESGWIQGHLFFAHPGRVVTQYQTASLFGQAFITAATMTTAINAFRATGIWPIDRHVFSGADFPSAETTDNPENPEENSYSTDIQPNNDPPNVPQIVSPIDISTSQPSEMSTEKPTQ